MPERNRADSFVLAGKESDKKDIVKSVKPIKKLRRPVGVSRARAATIARKRLARAMINCAVFDEITDWFQPGYDSRPLPPNCWYVICSPGLVPPRTGGKSIVLCISKKSGRVLRIEYEQGE